MQVRKKKKGCDAVMIGSSMGCQLAANWPATTNAKTKRVSAWGILRTKNHTGGVFACVFVCLFVWWDILFERCCAGSGSMTFLPGVSVNSAAAMGRDTVFGFIVSIEIITFL